MAYDIFSANYMLGKVEYPDIFQGLKGSCYPETRSVIFGPSVRVEVFEGQVTSRVLNNIQLTTGP